MIIRKRDPAAMTWEESLTEIAAIMARGYLRIISSRAHRNCLDAARDSEPDCAPVNGRQSTALLEDVV